MFEKTLSCAQRIIFREIGPKFPAGFFKNHMNKLFIIFEKIGCNFDTISKAYVKLYSDLVKKEISLANVSNESTVLVIGCGSIPTTSIILAEHLNIRIVAIDKDPRAVINASRYVKNLNLQEKIKIMSSGDTTYLVKDFDVIFVLYGATEQLKLMKHLSENITTKSRIVYRASRDLKYNLHETYEHLLKLFNIEDVVRTEFFGPMDSYLLSKKDR